MNEMMLPPFLLGSVVILSGLVFVLFVGRHRRAAPGSPDTPIAGRPEHARKSASGSSRRKNSPAA